MNKSLYGIHIDPDSDDNNVPQRCLLYTSKDKENYTLMDTGTSIPRIAWKLTKNQSHIINDISFPDLLPHIGFSQRFKVNANSPSMTEQDIGLLYHLIKQLLLTRKNTRPDILTCVLYIITRMESPTDYLEDAHLNVEVLLMKKI